MVDKEPTFLLSNDALPISRGYWDSGTVDQESELLLLHQNHNV